MRLRYKNLLLMACLSLTLCALNCEAQYIQFSTHSSGQVQQAKVIDKLPDGSYIISIDSAEFRALPSTKVIELAKQKIDLDAALKTNAELSSQLSAQSHEIDLLKKDVVIAQQTAKSFEDDFKRSQEDAHRNMGLFLGERALRQEASQFLPHGNVNGFGGKVLSFLDSTAGQSLFKLVIPTTQFVKTMYGTCK